MSLKNQIVKNNYYDSQFPLDLIRMRFSRYRSRSARVLRKKDASLPPRPYPGLWL